MIIFVFHRTQVKTHKAILKLMGRKVRVWSYDRFFRAWRHPRATYVFGDFDRLNAWDLELAARAFRVLAQAGARTLNDPARARQRYELLHHLHKEGVNGFRVRRVADSDGPDRFPVFLRTGSLHRGVWSELLHTSNEVDEGVARMVAAGIPEREILVVEYAAEETRPGLFRKLAAFRVGDRIVTTLSVHDPSWCAKHGVKNIAGEELYADELAGVRDDPYAAAIMRAFEVAQVDYGRADFAIVGGRPQVYEINMNPTIARQSKHPSPLRRQADALFFERLGAAYRAIDSPSGPSISLDADPILAKQRRRDRLFVRTRHSI